MHFGKFNVAEADLRITGVVVEITCFTQSGTLANSCPHFLFQLLKALLPLLLSVLALSIPSSAEIEVYFVPFDAFDSDGPPPNWLSQEELREKGVPIGEISEQGFKNMVGLLEPQGYQKIAIS